MATRQLRVCDVCETDYTEDNPAWMIMVAPNAPAEMQPVEYDFCSFDCLNSFVTSPEDEEEVDDSLSQETDNHTRPTTTMPQVEEVEVPDYVKKAAETPIPRADGTNMTLMDALAMGLKPDARA